MNLDEKIRVRFVTDYKQYKVPDAPLAIPSSLNRKGLTEIINHLLNGENSDDDYKSSQKFDFLIENHILRQPLNKFLNTYQISSENIVTIDYIPAVSFQDESQSCEIPAWIGSLDASIEGFVLTGCYDGNIHVLSSDNEQSFEVITSLQGHDEPIRAMTVFHHSSNSNGNNNNRLIATGGKDKTVKLFGFTNTSTSSSSSSTKKQKQSTPSSSLTGPRLFPLAAFEGHINSIESIEYMNFSNSSSTDMESSGSEFILTGDWSGNVFVWDILHNEHIQNNINTFSQNPAALDINISNNNANTVVARKKTKNGIHSAIVQTNNGDDVHQGIDTQINIKPLYTIHAHAQSISNIKAMSNGSSNNTSNTTSNTSPYFLTSSWDHNIKQYNLETQDCIHTFSTMRVVTSIDYSAHFNAILSSHTDGKIKLWDVRQKSNNNSGMDISNNINDTSGGNSAMMANNNIVSTSCAEIFGRASSTQTQWISQVKWQSSSSSSFLFAASYYDGCVKLWDTRSSATPLASTECHDGKVLCLDWSSDSGAGTGGTGAKVFSGGSDCFVKATSIVQ